MIKIFLYLLLFYLTKNYLFSVIISIYNTARYLDDSIGSLIKQSINFKNIQIILVNDGSTDNTEEICLKYKNLYDKNIIYIKIVHSGVSKARNIGLRYASGLYINFLDSDDKWDFQAFWHIHIFFKLYKKVDVIGCRIKYFETNNNYHLLDYKFNTTRITNLTKEYNCIQLHAASSFFRYSSIKGEKFDENIFYGEDTKFIANLILFKPIIGLVKEAIYYYRKRCDSTSAIQNTENKINFFFPKFKLVYEYLINKSKLLYKQIYPFIQFYIAYDIMFIISSEEFKYLNKINYTKYCNEIEKFLRQIDDKYILEQKVFPSKLQMLALSKKYNMDIRNNIILNNKSFIYSNHIITNLTKYKNIIIWRILEIKKNNLHLEGEDRCWMPRDKYFYYCELENKKIYSKYYYSSNYDFKSIYGIIEKGRVITFDIIINKKEIQNLHFFITYMGNNIEIFPSFNSFTHVPPLINSYYIAKNYIIQNNKNLVIYLYNKNLELLLENQYCKELKKIKKEYIIKYRQKYIQYKNQKNKNQIWLINDRKDQAGDNGEYFFRYLLEENPKGIKFYFIIKKNCIDFIRLKKFNNIIIDFNSTMHLEYFLKADKIISSISDSWVNNPFIENGKYLIDLYHYNFIYLQNGILKDDLSQLLNKLTKHFDLLITSSKYEYKSILHFNYGYKKNNIILTGLSRFDNLKKLQQINKKEKIILLYPTWRKYIKGTINLLTQESIESENFKETPYFNFYNDFINDPELIDIMKKYKYKGLFCLHPNFSAQKKYFNQNKYFSVKKKCFQQNIFTKASLLITDYSSISFDFGYIGKPIIYVQFDYDEYRKKQFPKSYFDYHKYGFGPVCYDIKCTIKNIKNEIENDCTLKKIYSKRQKSFFAFHDLNNNKRIYSEIIKATNENQIDIININFFKIIFLLLIYIKALKIFTKLNFVFLK